MPSSTDPEQATGWRSLPVAVITTLVKLGGIISTLLILVILLLVTYAVIQRYLLGTPLIWADELLGYLLVALVMFGAAEALRQRDHIAIDLLTAKAGRKTGRLLRLWSDVAVFAFAAVLGISAWDSIIFAYDFGSYSAGAIEMATWIPQLPMLAAAILLALVATVRIFGAALGSSQT